MEPVRAILELAQTQLFVSKNQEQGDGHAVVLFPGLGADQAYMTPLAVHCRRLGHPCLHWGRGRNTGPIGPTVAWLDNLAEEIDELIGGYSERVTLIGWSLGGIYAREVAKAIPERVRQVITLGTPSANISESTNARWLYEMVNGGGSAALNPELAARLGTPPPLPTTSTYSRSDGVVAWQACRLPPGAMRENVEVDSSHLGLTWHPDVLKVVAEHLRQADRLSVAAAPSLNG